ncbi:distal tail protein Dit [Facklamia sp. P9177]|uniref:distal tail protein Dit n=1 Tax=Facklamia sp. P9177 TaxID=3421945 RepID=UPI003D163337
MLYQFIGPSEVGSLESPSDNLAINGQYIDDIIPGYRQIYTAGRGLVDREVDTQPIPLYDGVWVNYYQDRERIIEIGFILAAHSNEELRESLTKLNDLLRQEDLTLIFDDEKDWYYNAIYTKASLPEETDLTLVGSILFLCPKPRKRRVTISENTNTITEEVYKQTTPKTIIANVTKTTNHVEIINGGQRIVLDGAYDAGKDITIDFSGDEVSITYEGRLINSDLALHSDLEFFYIKKGDIITGNGVTITKVTWRNEAL